MKGDEKDYKHCKSIGSLEPIDITKRTYGYISLESIFIPIITITTNLYNKKSHNMFC